MVLQDDSVFLHVTPKLHDPILTWALDLGPFAFVTSSPLTTLHLRAEIGEEWF